MKNYKKIKGFIQNEYIRIADMKKLGVIREQRENELLENEEERFIN